MKTKLVATIQITDNSGPGDYPASGNFTISEVMSLTDGTGADKAQIVFADTRTLGASASEDLDLAGSLEDNFGQVLTFTKVKSILIKADDDNSENIVLGGASSNAFSGPFADATDKLNVEPGATHLLTAPDDGWTVTDGTGDLLAVAAGASGGSYTIVIVGEGSAA